MKFAISTLGLPGMPIADVARLVADAGYHGVELRAHPEEPVHTGIGMRERAATAAQFADHGIEILAVAGYARVAQPLPPASWQGSSGSPTTWAASTSASSPAATTPRPPTTQRHSSSEKQRGWRRTTTYAPSSKPTIRTAPARPRPPSSTA